jgi:hypothetical protein
MIQSWWMATLTYIRTFAKVKKKDNNNISDFISIVDDPVSRAGHATGCFWLSIYANREDGEE